jgi:hypothetical protein
MYLARRDDGGVGGGVEGGKLVTKRLDRTGSRKGNAGRGTFRLRPALSIMVYDGERLHTMRCDENARDVIERTHSTYTLLLALSSIPGRLFQATESPQYQKSTDLLLISRI